MPLNSTWDEDDEVNEFSPLRREAEEEEVVVAEEGCEDGAVVSSVCPYCLAMIDEQSEQCPACGMYICEEDAPQSKWMWLGFLLSIIAVAGFVVQHYF